FQRRRLSLHLASIRRVFPLIHIASTARVHPRSDLHDLNQTFTPPMSSLSNLLADDSEPFEVAALARQERITNEMRNDPVEDVLESARFPLHCLIASIGTDASAP